MDKENKKSQQQFKIELDESVSQGEYVNFAIVTHSPAEFVMDYVRVVPGVPKSKVCLLYTSPSPRDLSTSRMPSSA